MRLATLAISLLLFLCPSAAALGAILPSATIVADLPLVEEVEVGANALVVPAQVVEARALTPLASRIDGKLHAPAIGFKVTPARVVTGPSVTLLRAESAFAPLERAPATAPSMPLPLDATRAPPEHETDALPPRVLSRAGGFAPAKGPEGRAAEAPRPPPAKEIGGWSAPLAAGAFLMVLAPMALYHHLRGAAVAEQATRQRIRELLRESPGLGSSEVARPLGIDRSTARYHLARLMREGLVAAEGPRRRLRFFTIDSVAPAERRRFVATRRHERLLDAIEQAPGAAKAHLRGRLAISRAALDGRLQALARDGLVRLERDGRRVRVFPISF